MLQVLNEKTGVFRNISPTQDNWITGSTGYSGFSYTIIIRKQSASLQLVVKTGGDTELNKMLFDRLYQKKTEIESDFGAALNWRRMDEQISSCIQYDMDTLRLDDRGTWDLGMIEISDKFLLWDQAFKKWIKELV